ncbi:MAG: class I SAM-dependent methyltransferase [Gammaproteobacteria bacterium]|nr:MAG: class I SAM-dependent methyltransferase [Gammaproteobacteria bacterium]
MSNKILPLDEALYAYLLSVSLRESNLLERLREETARDPMSRMQSAPEQGQFMALLVRLIGARKCLEIGVFTGYSAIWVAQALPADGRLIACDTSEKWTAIARRYWEEAGIADRIRLHLGPAMETLDDLLDTGEAGRFDFAFIDADKGNYLNYYERTLQLLRPGGLIVIDNTLWSGDVADPEKQDDDTVAIRILNEFIHRDDRVEMSLLPVADGLTLVLKK